MLKHPHPAKSLARKGFALSARVFRPVLHHRADVVAAKVHPTNNLPQPPYGGFRRLFTNLDFFPTFSSNGCHYQVEIQRCRGQSFRVQRVERWEPRLLETPDRSPCRPGSPRRARRSGRSNNGRPMSRHAPPGEHLFQPSILPNRL